MRSHYAVLSSNYDIYLDLMCTKAYTLPINSQKKKLSELISYMQIDKEVTTSGSQELKNTFFNFYFLIQDIFFPTITFHTLIENICMEGTMSQIFDIGPSFYFMKSRKIIMKKI